MVNLPVWFVGAASAVQASSLQPKVVQVSPTPKHSPGGRPTDVHELLQQLGLAKYEQIFREQDVDLEVGVCGWVCMYVVGCMTLQHTVKPCVENRTLWDYTHAV